MTLVEVKPVGQAPEVALVGSAVRKMSSKVIWVGATVREPVSVVLSSASIAALVVVDISFQVTAKEAAWPVAAICAQYRLPPERSLAVLATIL